MHLFPRIAVPTALFIMTLAFAATSAAAPVLAPANSAMASHQVADLTNAQRTVAGLPTLQWNDTLANSAASYAADMASRNYFSHYSPEGTSPIDRDRDAGYPSFEWGMYVGENLAKGFDSPDSVMQGWLKSEGHRHNVFLPDYVDIGVAVAAAPDGTLYWVQEFGSRPFDQVE